jgi:hypothetical protein
VLGKNPYRPGAGQMPPYLAGRERETRAFEQLLEQEVILDNMVLTGLRGVGKTVLLETFRPIAQAQQWLWVGTDLSESASLSEEKIARRLLTDLSVVTSSFVVGERTQRDIGFGGGQQTVSTMLGYDVLGHIYDQTPGLVADKLKRVLELVHEVLQKTAFHGLVFAYDEAQNLADHVEKDEFPMSLLLDVFQSIQRRGMPYMLLLTGLPTLFPKLVEARTFAERMFRVIQLDRLDYDESRAAILKPLELLPGSFPAASVELVIEDSGGYPYFIQFICREVFDIFVARALSKEEMTVPRTEIIRKLDTDFFAGRWARATDRQRELLGTIAKLDHCDGEFTVQEIVEQSRILVEAGELDKSFSSSHVNQMLATLTSAGLIYKNRHGKYSFAVPLLGQFIRRQLAEARLV